MCLVGLFLFSSVTAAILYLQYLDLRDSGGC